MAKNEIFKDANYVSLPVTADTPSGSPVVVGGLCGVAQTAEGEGGNNAGEASVALVGGWRVTVAGGAVSVGDPVYIASDYTVTTATAGNFLFGHALTETSGAGEEATVRLVGSNNGAEA